MGRRHVQRVLVTQQHTAGTAQKVTSIDAKLIFAVIYPSYSCKAKNIYEDYIKAKISSASLSGT